MRGKYLTFGVIGFILSKRGLSPRLVITLITAGQSETYRAPEGKARNPLETSTIYIIGAVVLLAIFILIGRLAVRWVVRLTMIGVIIVALAGGAVFWWWTRSLSEKVPPAKPRATPAKRATNR